MLISIHMYYALLDYHSLSCVYSMYIVSIFISYTHSNIPMSTTPYTDKSYNMKIRMCIWSKFKQILQPRLWMNKDSNSVVLDLKSLLCSISH